MNCSECKYFNPIRATVGQCRRYPPQVIVHNAEGQPDWKEDVWPEVYDNEWCGEFLEEHKESFRMNKLTELENLIYKIKLTTKSGETLSLCGFRKHDRRIIAQDETGEIHILNRHEVKEAAE
jgi:hypothetical protein